MQGVELELELLELELELLELAVEDAVVLDVVDQDGVGH